MSESTSEGFELKCRVLLLESENRAFVKRIANLEKLMDPEKSQSATQVMNAKRLLHSALINMTNIYFFKKSDETTRKNGIQSLVIKNEIFQQAGFKHVTTFIMR